MAVLQNSDRIAVCDAYDFAVNVGGRYRCLDQEVEDLSKNIE